MTKAVMWGTETGKPVREAYETAISETNVV